MITSKIKNVLKQCFNSGLTTWSVLLNLVKMFNAYNSLADLIIPEVFTQIFSIFLNQFLELK